VKTFEFTLSEPIEYSTKGEVREGTSITFYAPKANQRKKVMKLKQTFFQSLPKGDGTPQQEKQTPNEVPEIDGDAVLFIVAQSTADYAEFIEIGRSVICDRNAKIDDNEYLTVVTLDKVDIDEMEKMVGQYVANFIVKSALKSLGKN